MVWDEKMVFGIFWPFLMALAWKKHCLAFFWNLWLSCCCRLEIKWFFWGQTSSLFCHGPILEDTSGFGLLVKGW